MNLKEYFSSGEKIVDLAEKINKSSSYLWQLSDGRRSCPANLAPMIEQSTEGKVTRKDLRPDDWHLIWPELIDQDGGVFDSIFPWTKW